MARVSFQPGGATLTASMAKRQNERALLVLSTQARAYKPADSAKPTEIQEYQPRLNALLSPNMGKFV